MWSPELTHLYSGLMLALDDNYTFIYTKDNQNQFQSLFFVHKQSQKLLKSNEKVLVLNCTYWTNQFKISLLDVLRVTALNTTSYVGFCFMTKKERKNYVWVLQNLQALCNSLKIEAPKVIVMDHELTLMNTIAEVFPTPNMTSLLCVWHVNKAIFTRCRTGFTDVEWSFLLLSFSSGTKP